jgi:hypothetical protein
MIGFGMLEKLEPATGLNGATCHRLGPEACLTDSYEGGQPPTLETIQLPRIFIAVSELSGGGF